MSPITTVLADFLLPAASLPDALRTHNAVLRHRCTLKEVFAGHYGVGVNDDGVLGVLWLIFWSLLWVVSIKYVLFILRADNEGEGA